MSRYRNSPTENTGSQVNWPTDAYNGVRLAARHDETNRLGDVLRSLLMARRGRAVTLNLRGPVAVRPWSNVFYGLGDAYPVPVAVKQCCNPATGEPDGAAAATYFRALSDLASYACRHVPASVPVPFDVFESLGVAVVAWIDGPTLSSHLLEIPVTEVDRALAAAGTWLANLHAATGCVSGCIDVHSVLDSVEHPGTVPAHATDGVIAAAIEVLHARSAEVARWPVPFSRLHGDFKPDNLILVGDQLCGIDVDLRYPGPVMQDAAHFLNHFRTTLQTPRGITRAGYIASGERSFVHGYAAASGERLALLPLQWLRLADALRLLLGHSAWSRPLLGRLTSWFLRRLVGDITQALRGIPSDSYLQLAMSM